MWTDLGDLQAKTKSMVIMSSFTEMRHQHRVHLSPFSFLKVGENLSNAVVTYGGTGKSVSSTTPSTCYLH